MQGPPKNQTAPVAGRGGGDRHSGSSTRDLVHKPILRALQAPTFTAVPLGTWWQVKCLSPSGHIALFGRFDGRLPALGAAVLLAAQTEGRVLP